MNTSPTSPVIKQEYTGGTPSSLISSNPSSVTSGVRMQDIRGDMSSTPLADRFPHGDGVTEAMFGHVADSIGLPNPCDPLRIPSENSVTGLGESDRNSNMPLSKMGSDRSVTSTMSDGFPKIGKLPSDRDVNDPLMSRNTTLMNSG